MQKHDEMKENMLTLTQTLSSDMAAPLYCTNLSAKSVYMPITSSALTQTLSSDMAAPLYCTNLRAKSVYMPITSSAL
jgi:hypothetical protein